MGARVTITLRFEDAATAAAVDAATSPDNPASHVRQTRAGHALYFEAWGPSVSSVRESADDFLRCATSGLKAATLATGRPRPGTRS